MDSEVLRPITPLSIVRDAACASVPSTVSYEATDGTAVYGTHYQFVDEDGNALPASGVLNWAADESGEQTVCVEILDAIPDTPAEDPEGPCCEETEATPVDATFCVDIKDATGTTLGSCTTVCVAIRNRTPGNLGATQFE